MFRAQIPIGTVWHGAPRAQRDVAGQSIGVDVVAQVRGASTLAAGAARTARWSDPHVGPQTVGQGDPRHQEYSGTGVAPPANASHARRAASRVSRSGFSTAGSQTLAT